MTTMWKSEQGAAAPTVGPVHPTFSHGGPCNGDSSASDRVTPGEQVDREQVDVVYPSTFGQCPNDGENRAYENPGGISFRALIAEDFRAHGRDWHSPGFRALLVHRFGNLRMSVRNRSLRVPLSLLYRWGERRVRSTSGIEIPFDVRIGRRVEIHHHSGIVINGYVEIGDGCIIRQNVTIGIKAIGDRGAPILGRNVEVGAGAVILGHIRIGDGARIGANAVVMTDVPDGATAVGVPARIIAA